MRVKMIQQYFDAFWASKEVLMDKIWEALNSEERYFVETRGAAPWQNN